MNYFLSFLLVGVLGVWSFGAQAQNKVWNLQQCIEYAIQHNLNIAQSQLNSKNMELTKNQNYWNMAPNLNGFASHAYNIGRRIDPFTNQFANSTVRSNNFYLSSQVTLFNGLQQQNLIRQGNYDFEASKLDVEKIKQDIALNVANAYLSILLAEEVLTNSKKQREITLAQKERTMKLVEAGSLAIGNQYDIESQLANEDYNVIAAENQVTMAYLYLTQLMNYTEQADLLIEKPENLIPAESILQSTAEGIFQSAVAIQPDIKSAELKTLSAKSQLALARGTASPNLSLSGSIGTGYSGLSKELVGSPTITGFTPSGITSGGDTVFTPEISYDTRTTPFGKQFSDNINKNITFNLTIPIFNQRQSRTGINRAKIALESAQLTTSIRKQNLEQNIQKAYTDAKAALKQYEASTKAVSASKESFRYAEQRYNAGALSAMDYSNSKSRLAMAEVNLYRSKFDLVFKLKVLELYQKGISGL
ncbi:MAG: TolC family protein [Bacteroidia bacterium]|nr:TolC family protein [Bacteroidia bacterium]